MKNRLHTTQQYLSEHGDRFLSELFELLRIPSISAEKAHASDMVRCAEWLRDALLASGAEQAAVMPTAGAPVVYAERIIDPTAPTVLVYGHYDVMPVEPTSAWNNPPFEPTLIDGRIYARGANDNKGQLYMHAKALETMLKTDGLPCNLKFMIEGEEEVGSANLEAWCVENRAQLAADVILVSDTSLLAWESPSITAGLRGLTYMEVEVTGPNKDLHSGLYGGAVTNPINALCQMIASLTDAQGRITIPHFYDRVRELTPTERTAFGTAPFCEQGYRRALDIRTTAGEAGYSTMERTGVRPALDVNGIWGGHTGEGSKTVIPSKAYAKISMRLVPDQDFREIATLFENHFQSIAPAGVQVKVHYLHGGAPYVSPSTLPAYQAAQKALSATFGKEPLPFYSGGSIPIISAFERTLGIKSILMGFGLAEDAIHSPNESYAVANFYRGIETIVLFHEALRKQLRTE